MTKLLLIFALICPLQANRVVNRTVEVGGPTLVFSEGFEGTDNGGYENVGWTTLGDGNPNSTTAPASGAQSFGHDSSTGGCTSHDFGPLTNMTWKGTFRMSSSGSSLRGIMTLMGSDGTTGMASIQINGSNAITITQGTSSTSGGLTVTTATFYYWWLDYVAGSGGNGIARFYTSATDSKPVSPTAEITTGDATGAVHYIKIAGNSTGQPTAQWDDIKVYAN